MNFDYSHFLDEYTMFQTIETIICPRYQTKKVAEL